MAQAPFLKRATNRRKYKHMQFVMDFKADLKERAEKMRELRLDFGDTLTSLKLNDPNWEKWYDGCKDIPEEIRFNDNDLRPVLYRMETRILHTMLRDEGPYMNLVAKDRTNVS